MNPIHRLIRLFGRELSRVPRPLAYNWRGWLRPSLGPLLAYMHLTHPDFFFIQVGAHDGQFADPIHEFVERFRLRGLLLEPQPELFASLQITYSHRPDLVLVNAAIAHEDGTVKLHRVKPKYAPEQWVTGTASLLKEKLDSIGTQIKSLDQLSEIIEVPAITPRTLLHQYGVARFDLLQIDTQGFDYEVIKLFDIEHNLPAIIHFEHDMLSTQEWEECISRLLNCGYRISHTGQDTLACRRDVIPAD